MSNKKSLWYESTSQPPVFFYTSKDDNRVHLVIGDIVDIQLHEAVCKRLLDHIDKVLCTNSQLSCESNPLVIFSTSGEIDGDMLVGNVTINISRYGDSELYSVLVIFDHTINLERMEPLLFYNYVNADTILSIKGRLGIFFKCFFSDSDG